MQRLDSTLLSLAAFLFAIFFAHVAYGAATRTPFWGLLIDALLLLSAVICFSLGCLYSEKKAENSQHSDRSS